MNQNEQAIASVLAQYEQALDQSSTESVMKLYAPDGVFMPHHSPSGVGTEAVRKAYDNVFNTITLKVNSQWSKCVNSRPNEPSCGRTPLAP